MCVPRRSLDGSPTERRAFHPDEHLSPQEWGLSLPGFDGDSNYEDSVLGEGISISWQDDRSIREELMDRGVRLALESGRPIAHVARDLGIGPEALRKRVRQAEADGGKRPDLPSSEEREEIKRAARGGVRAAPRERDPEGRLGVFRDRARRRPAEVSAFIDQHRERFGVEPICGTWTCRRPPTTSEPVASGRRAAWRTSG